MGRKEIWPLHRCAAELGGDLRTGLERHDIPARRFPRAPRTADLIKALASIARESGTRDRLASEEARRARPYIATEGGEAMTVHRFDAVRTSPFYRSEHEAFRQSLRKFVAREIEPFAHDWDEAGEFPRALYKKAAAAGYMGLGFPERYGGTGKVTASCASSRCRRSAEQAVAA